MPSLQPREGEGQALRQQRRSEEEGEIYSQMKDFCLQSQVV